MTYPRVEKDMDASDQARGAGSLASEYRRLWEDAAECPDVFAFLTSRLGCSCRERLDVVRVDLRCRWQCGQPLPIKVYLGECPDIAARADFVRILVQTDQSSRREFGNHAAPLIQSSPEPTPQSQTQVFDQPGTNPSTIADEPALKAEPPHHHQGQTPDSNALRETLDRHAASEQLGFKHDSSAGRRTESVSHWPQIENSRFTLLRRLGIGGMGLVYEAYDQDRGEFVALKMMRQADHASLVRFKQEFRTLCDLTHPNLVNLYQLFAVETPWYFTMELVDGCDFLAYVRGRGLGDSLPETQVSSPTAQPGMRGVPTLHASHHRHLPRFDETRLRDALIQLASGVQALHLEGKLHRDIKPTNVLVARGGRVVLLDFGLIADLEAAGEHRSPDRQVVGTLAHMAPEQAIGSKLTMASDWYSVGIILYQSLTGKVPFEGPYEEVVSQKLRAVVQSPSDFVENLPKDLVDLCMDLLKANPRERPDGAEVLERLTGKAAGRGCSGPPRPVRLIGRDWHRQVLNTACASLHEHRPCAVFVQGRAGTGKTALVRSFVQFLKDDKNALVLSGRCNEREWVPFKALDSLVDGLARYLKQLGACDRNRLLPDDTALLARVFPVLNGIQDHADLKSDSELSLDHQEVRLRAFAALRELLCRLGETVNLVLVIDDLQWGDAESALLIAELLYGLRPPRLLFVGCTRLEDAEQSQLLPILMRARQASVAPIEHHDLAVEPLTQSDSRELARVLLGGDDPQTLAAAHLVACESEGNPLFVHELVKHVQSVGLKSDLLRADRLDLESVLWSRIQSQSSEAQRLLEVVSVSFRPIPETVAIRAAGLERGGREALASLRVSRLIRILGTGHTEIIEIYHDRIRTTVRDHLSPEQQRQIHQNLANLLGSMPHADAEALAEHFQGAGDLERAHRSFLQAADKAFDALAFEHAAKLYQRAIDSGCLPGTEARSYRKLGEALASTGRSNAAAGYLLRAAQYANAAETVELRKLAATQLLVGGHVEEGHSLLSAVLESLGMHMPATPREALGSLLRYRAILRLRGIRFRERDESQLSAEELSRIDLCWSAASGLSVIDPIVGAHFQTRGLLLALRAGEPARVARALAAESAQHGTSGNRGAKRADILLQAAELLAIRLDSPRITGLTQTVRGLNALMLGHWQPAQESLDKAALLFRDHSAGVTWERAAANTFAVWSLLQRGELKEVRQRWTALTREARDRGDMHSVTTLATYFSSMVRLADDDADRIEKEIAAAMDPWSGHGFCIQHSSACRSLVHMHLYRQRPELAWERLTSTWRHYSRSLLFRIQMVRIQMLELRARCALALAEISDHPAPYLESAAKDARSLVKENQGWSVAHAQFVRAGIAACRGDQAVAFHHLIRAAELYDHAGMTLHSAVLRYRAGEIQTGDEARRLISIGERIMREQTIKSPGKWAQMMAPGFANIATCRVETSNQQAWP